MKKGFRKIDINFIRQLTGNLDRNRVNLNDSGMNSVWQLVNKNYDSEIDIEEITSFINNLMEYDKNGNNDGILSNKEINKYLKDLRKKDDIYTPVNDIKAQTVREFLEIFINYSDKSSDNNTRTDNDDGSYSISTGPNNKKRITNFDKDNHIISIEENYYNKTTVKDANGNIIKIITREFYDKKEEIYENGKISRIDYYKQDDNDSPYLLIKKEYYENEIRSYTDFYSNNKVAYRTIKNGNREAFYCVTNGECAKYPEYEVIYGENSNYPQTKIEYENNEVVNEYHYDNSQHITSHVKYMNGVKVETSFAPSYANILISKKEDGVIDHHEQGDTGDCWLLDGLDALSTVSWGRQAIKDCISRDENGNIVVHLEGAYGKKKDFIVTPEEIEQADENDEWSFGDRDSVIFEIALEKYRRQFGERNDDGGKFEEISRLILGKNRYYVKLNEKSEISHYIELLKNNPDEYVIDTGFELEEGWHSICVKRVETGVDGKTYVILSNPYDNRAEIRMTKTEFLNKVGYIEVTKRPDKYKNTKVEDINSDSKIGTFKMGTKSSNQKFLSILCSLYSKPEGEKLIKQIIKHDSKGNIIIEFPNTNYPMVISKYDIARAQFSGMYSTGDDDVTALEIALERYANKDNNNTPESVNYTDYTQMSADEILSLLSGEEYETWHSIPDVIKGLNLDYINSEVYTVEYNGEYYSVKRVETNALGQIVFVLTSPIDTSIELKYTSEEMLHFDLCHHLCKRKFEIL
ncbi:hypothetical protein IJ579_01710 [bacterium]|nr:hypothetical protein [bacterium]